MVSLLDLRLDQMCLQIKEFMNSLIGFNFNYFKLFKKNLYFSQIDFMLVTINFQKVKFRVKVPDLLIKFN